MKHRDKPMDDLVARLRVLGSKKPTPERRSEVRDALSHKREGVQAVAGQVLAAWGGRESVADLRAWLARIRERQGGEPGSVAIQALASCISREDVEWVLDLYFGQKDAPTTHLYLRLAAAVDAEEARPRIERELRNPDPVKRHAALVLIRWMRLPGGPELARPLVEDEDGSTRRLAREMTA